MYKRFADEVFDDLVDEMEESEQDKFDPVTVAAGAAAVEAGVAVGTLTWNIGKEVFDAEGRNALFSRYLYLRSLDHLQDTPPPPDSLCSS